jgi:hypothetical protein
MGGGELKTLNSTLKTLFGSPDVIFGDLTLIAAGEDVDHADLSNAHR